MTDAQFVAWLKSSASIRCVLVEVNVMVGGVETTRYLSSKGYVTSPTDTPANTLYAPGIVGGVTFTETLPLDGSASLAFGDIEIENVAGNRDTWFDDVWDNRAIKVFIGDMAWTRSDFRQIFEGITAGIAAKDRGRINLKISDKLQRLNTPVTENKLGGTTANAERLIPLCFGECHNIEPLLVDATVNEYQVHDGPIESIIEVRDNGVPVAITPFLTTGKFRLAVQPSGQITASVQGAKPAEVLSPELNSEYTCDTMSTWTESVVGIGSIVSGKIRVSSTGAQARLSKRFPTIPGFKYRVSYDATASGSVASAMVNLVSAASVVSSNGPLFPVVGAGTSASRSMDITATGFECTVILYITGAGAYADFDNVSFRQIQDGAYINTAPSLIRYIATRYGKAADRLTYDEIDAELNSYEAMFTQPVGLYLSERTNAIQAITDLAGSIGAKPMFNRSGKFTLVRVQGSSDAPTAALMWQMDGPNTYVATGWAPQVGTITYSGGKATITSGAGAQQRFSAGVVFPGSLYTRVRAKVKRLSGSGWIGNCLYATDGHVQVTSYSQVTAATIAVGETQIVEWDMTNLFSGGTDWVDNTIRSVRLDFGLDGTNDSFEIDWIVIDSGPTAVTPTDMVQGSLAVSSLPAVKAGVKIGYCKNWTVQSNGVAAGVDIRDADLFKQQWLTITQTDTATQANYKTFLEPDQQDTLLLTNADAMAEAQRRLSIYNTQRKVLKYAGMPWLMLEKLGGLQKLTNSRFGLSNGAAAQIISTSVDWLNPHITVEILV